MRFEPRVVAGCPSRPRSRAPAPRHPQRRTGGRLRGKHRGRIRRTRHRAVRTPSIWQGARADGRARDGQLASCTVPRPAIDDPRDSRRGRHRRGACTPAARISASSAARFCTANRETLQPRNRATGTGSRTAGYANTGRPETTSRRCFNSAPSNLAAGAQSTDDAHRRARHSFTGPPSRGMLWPAPRKTSRRAGSHRCSTSQTKSKIRLCPPDTTSLGHVAAARASSGITASQGHLPCI